MTSARSLELDTESRPSPEPLFCRWPDAHFPADGKRNTTISLWGPMNYLLWNKMEALPTCINPLPAHGEERPRLDEVTGDWAAVVSAGTPGQLGCAVCHLLHRHRVWRTGRAWLDHRKRHSEGLAHADAQTRLQNADVCAHKTRTAKHFCRKNTSAETTSLSRGLRCL